jgi:hypothetical protein
MNLFIGCGASLKTTTCRKLTPADSMNTPAINNAAKSALNEALSINAN